MNKKTRKMKKDVKRSLRDIGFKKSCKTLKSNFLSVYKTAIYDSSYHLKSGSNSHIAWENLQQPLIEEVENGYVLENSGCFLPLNISKATEYILWCKKYTKVLVSCYNFQDMELNWTTM